MINKKITKLGLNIRWSYCNIWKTKSINEVVLKFNVSLIILKIDILAIKKVIKLIKIVYNFLIKILKIKG